MQSFVYLVLAFDCTIQQLDGKDATNLSDLTKPTLIRHLIDDWSALGRWDTSEAFVSKFGHHRINANRTSFAYGGDHTTVRTFSRYAMTEHIIVMDDAKITMHEDRFLRDIGTDVAIPDLFENITQTRILSYGGGFWGVDFMQHCEAWVGVVAGSKLWYFAAPEHEYIPTTCDNPSSDPRIQTCLVSKGDVVYVPNMWWHATCNMEEHTIAVGTQCTGGFATRSWKTKKDEL